MLQSSREEERLNGLRLLARSGFQTPPDHLLQALGDESWRVRKEASDLFLSLPSAGELAGQIVELLHAHDNAGLRNAAVDILTRLGRQAIPFLLEEVDCGDPDVRKFVLDILGEIGDNSCLEPMIAALKDSDENVRAAGAENLGKLKLADAVPALLLAMENADLLYRFTILEALGQIGAPVPVGRLLPFGDEPLLRKALFDCLGRIGGPGGLEPLVEGLIDPMRNVREAAAVALARISHEFPAVSAQLAGSVGESARQAVGGLLKSPNRQVQEAALQIVGLLDDGRFAAELLDLLEDVELRQDAFAGLVKLCNVAADLLLEFWETAGVDRRIYLAYIYGAARCGAARPLLVSGLHSGDSDLVQVCARSLGQIGDPGSIPDLIGALAAESEEIRQAAAQALMELAPLAGGTLLQEVVPLLEKDDPQLRMHGVVIIGQCQDSQTAEHLAFALKDESADVRRAAVRAMEGHCGSRHLHTLRLALTDEDADVRRLAAEVLGSTGDPEALAPLELALQDEDIWVRAAAVRSLGRLGGERATTLISQALFDPVGLVGIAALETLGESSPQLAYELSQKALAHEDEEVVTAAVKILAGSGRREWVGANRQGLINHRHWDVRANFIRAMVELEGPACRKFLEDRLLVEGEELVRQLLQDFLQELTQTRG
ncbi:HEAT repeat domain-containing protein [Desulfuromonas versatilis]|uniref:HEAT repeat domain-containing protein n=1 Tax=Desulfuromonas versatilis TaxID=2802975 RepID=UPI001C864A94|nr:HEAT repeat domain-containing protein [Desulfuromonas versatilis]